MTVLTFYPNYDGRLYSSDASDYSAARAGTGATLVLDSESATNIQFGQALTAAPEYTCGEAFISFDTSSIPDDATIDSVVLHLYGQADFSTTDFTVQARIFDWGGALATGDWQDGTELAALTLAATFPTSSWSTAGYNEFTSETAFKSNVSKTGNTRIVICSSRQVAGTTPTGNEVVNFWTVDETGTSKDPKLVVTYTTTGTVAATLQPLTAALAGTHEQTGAIAATLQPLTAALTGWHDAFGTIAATLQPLTALATGIWRRGGTNVPLGARASARLPRPGTGKARRD